MTFDHSRRIHKTLWEWIARLDSRFSLSALTANSSNAIVIYHSIGDPRLSLDISTERFERDIEFLSTEYEIVDLETVVTADDSNQKLVALTFDDGYKNFYTNAFPILREQGLPATVFVTSEFIGDRRAELMKSRLGFEGTPGGVMMTESQLREVSGCESISIGNHSRTHPRLTEVADDDALEDEIEGAKLDLEARFQTSIDSFCYPYGDFDDDVRELVQKSHALAVTIAPGLLHGAIDRYALPRIPAHVSEARMRLELTDLGGWIRQRAFPES